MNDSTEKIKVIYDSLDVSCQEECLNEIDRLQRMEEIHDEVHTKIQHILESSPVPKSEWLATSIHNKLLAIENLIKTRLG